MWKKNEMKSTGIFKFCARLWRTYSLLARFLVRKVAYSKRVQNYDYFLWIKNTSCYRHFDWTVLPYLVATIFVPVCIELRKKEKEPVLCNIEYWRRYYIQYLPVLLPFPPNTDDKSNSRSWTHIPLCPPVSGSRKEKKIFEYIWYVLLISYW